MVRWCALIAQVRNLQSELYMSKIGCVCGYVIRDQTDSLPYKAGLTLDVDLIEINQFIDSEVRDYVEAVKAGTVDEWLSVRGVSQAYLDLGFRHEQVLYDCVFSLSRRRQKTVYECESCGRLLVEGVDNQFLSYLPDSGRKNGVLSMTKKKQS
jgi:hypothetical protein